jgi:hypothetical protein
MYKILVYMLSSLTPAVPHYLLATSASDLIIQRRRQRTKVDRNLSSSLSVNSPLLQGANNIVDSNLFL